jgi:hypothetical protein
MAILGAALALGACSDGMTNNPLAPQPASLDFSPMAGTSEQIYLSDTREGGGGDGTRLLKVELDDVSGTAVLTQLIDLNTNEYRMLFDRAHIAASPDGKTVYLINRDPISGGNPLGAYDVGTSAFTLLGKVSGLPTCSGKGTVLAAFSPSGDLYLANECSSTVYRIDLGTLNIAEQWPVYKAGTTNLLDLTGGDIAFDADGVLYAWVNPENLSDQGVYRVDLGAGSASATALGLYRNQFVTGLAIRAAGEGPLVGSSRTQDAIIALDRGTGAITGTFPMLLGGAPFDHTFGDMTVGLLRLPPPPPTAGSQGCTPGYWKQKQHFGNWTGYSPNQLFSSVFEDAFPGKTLLQVLGQGGGGLNALGRHTVAALLDAASTIDYGLSTANVIDQFNAVYPDGDYEGQKNLFAARNERDCPLGR